MKRSEIRGRPESARGLAPYVDMAYFTYKWPMNRVSNGTKRRIGSIAPNMVSRSSWRKTAFFDPRRVIAEDLDHSGAEPRYFCFGKVAGGVMTVRFTYRVGRIRIFGAGYWRKGKGIYEQQNR
jgi:hypothetical protein